MRRRRDAEKVFDKCASRSRTILREDSLRLEFLIFCPDKGKKVVHTIVNCINRFRASVRLCKILS